MKSKSDHADDFYLFETLQYRRRQIVNRKRYHRIFFSLIFPPLFFFAGMDEHERITTSPSSKGRETVVKTIYVSRKLKNTFFLKLHLSRRRRRSQTQTVDCSGGRKTPRVNCFGQWSNPYLFRIEKS